MSKTTNSARSQHAFTVGGATLAVFLIVMAFLVWRLETGSDPVVGSPIAQAKSQPVIKRKLIIKHKVIEEIADRPALPPETTSSGTLASSGSGTSSYSAPASAPSSSAPAPAQSAPAPSPAPAPAPTTSAS